MSRSILGAAAGLALTTAFAGPAAAAPPLEAYGKLPGLEMASVSPSGERYAVVGVLQDQRQLVVMTAERAPLLAAPLGERKINDVEWAGEDKVVTFGSEAVALGPTFSLLKYEIDFGSVVDVKARQAIPLLNKGPAGNGIWGRYGIVEEGGRWYGYFGAITLARSKGSELFFESGHPDLYKVDLASGSPSLVARRADGEDSRRTWLVGADGGVLATLDLDTRDGSWRVRAGERGLTLASGVAPQGGVGLIGQGRTPGSIVYRKPDEEDQDHWIEVPLTGGEGVELLGEEDVVYPIHDRRTGLLIGFIRDADSPEPVFFDPPLKKRMEGVRATFPGVHMQLASWNDDFDRLIVHTDGQGDSGTWWFVNLDSNEAYFIGRSYPGVKAADVGPMRMVRYKAADGLAIEGVLTTPPGRPQKNLPLVVLPHGGPEARDYPTFDWMAQALASRGYAVFQPNFRGSSGYGQAFKDAGDGQWGRKMQTDISDGVAELARQGIVDPGRVCIMGASYGGYAALAGVTLQQGLYRCAVSVAGVSDLPAMLDYDRDASGGALTMVRRWREEIGQGAVLEDISPADQAARADAPVLLIHGKDDTVVPFEQSKRMESALRRAGKPVELVTLKGEDHNLSRTETRLAMLTAAVAFIERYNPPDAATAPSGGQ